MKLKGYITNKENHKYYEELMFDLNGVFDKPEFCKTYEEYLQKGNVVLCFSPYEDETLYWQDKKNEGKRKLLYCHPESHIVKKYIRIENE